jgi:hypothetical protein
MSKPPIAAKCRQNMLTGAPSIKGVNAMMYATPRGPHEMFVNAFYQACDVTLTREKCQQRAVEAWKEVKSDVKLQKKFMATGPHERMHILHKPVVKDHRVVNFFVPSQNLHAAGGEQSEANEAKEE